MQTNFFCCFGMPFTRLQLPWIASQKLTVSFINYSYVKWRRKKNEWTKNFDEFERIDSFSKLKKKQKIQTSREILILYASLRKCFTLKEFVFLLHFHFQIRWAVKLCDIQKYVWMKVFCFLFVIFLSRSVETVPMRFSGIYLYIPPPLWAQQAKSLDQNSTKTHICGSFPPVKDDGMASKGVFNVLIPIFSQSFRRFISEFKFFWC